MDSVLSNQLFFAIEQDPTPEEEVFDKVSMWVKEGDVIVPSMSVETFNKLTPGLYKVDVSRDRGYFAKKLEIDSDELLLFSNSVVPGIVEEVNAFLDKAEEYKKYKIIHKRGLLLYGYPGTGKSSIITLLCKELIKRKGVVFVVDGPNNLEVYTTFMKNYFRQIEPDTPIITIIEDLDNYRDSLSILDFLDGKSQIEHHLVITTTNNTKNIPSTFLRPSRIDLKEEIPYPSAEIRREYLKYKQFNSELLEEAVEVTENFSFADLKELLITVNLLNYSVSDAIKKITSKEVKKDYSSNRLKINEIAL